MGVDDDVVVLVCPEGAGPDQPIFFRDRGEKCKTVVPRNVRPGQRFRVKRSECLLRKRSGRGRAQAALRTRRPDGVPELKTTELDAHAKSTQAMMDLMMPRSLRRSVTRPEITPADRALITAYQARQRAGKCQDEGFWKQQGFRAAGDPAALTAEEEGLRLRRAQAWWEQYGFKGSMSEEKKRDYGNGVPGWSPYHRSDELKPGEKPGEKTGLPADAFWFQQWGFRTGAVSEEKRRDYGYGVPMWSPYYRSNKPPRSAPSAPKPRRAELFEARRSGASGAKTHYKFVFDDCRARASDIVYRDDRALLLSPRARAPALVEGFRGADVDAARSACAIAAKERVAALLAIGYFEVELGSRDATGIAARESLFHRSAGLSSTEDADLAAPEAARLVDAMGGAVVIPRRLQLAAGRRQMSRQLQNNGTQAQLDQAMRQAARASAVLDERDEASGEAGKQRVSEAIQSLLTQERVHTLAAGDEIDFAEGGDPDPPGLSPLAWLRGSVVSVDFKTKKAVASAKRKRRPSSVSSDLWKRSRVQLSCCWPTRSQIIKTMSRFGSSSRRS
ncbi:beta-lactamase [Aureococcus anophagefferens]|nr:beta-lactamase [Aureococcus anophagefferens]